MAPKARSRGTLNPNIPSKELTRALNVASMGMKDLKKQVLTPEALLLTLVRLEDVAAHKLLKELLNARGYRWDRFVVEVNDLARERIAPDENFDWLLDDGRRVPLSSELLIVLDEALTLAQARDEVYAGTEHALAGMTQPKVSTARLLEHYGITERAMQEILAEQSFARSATVTDHVALARQGEITPVYFREELLRDLIGLLTLASDRHVILVGPPGVGKRTLVYSLALLIAEGKGPPDLKSVVEINEEALLDNAKIAVQAGLRRAKGGILFVPHLARFFGGFRADFPEAAGKELQKAFFSPKESNGNGEVVIIGTDTEAEYAERLEQSTAIRGHAHALRVEATSIEETAAILDVLKTRFEADYGLTIADESLHEAARLAGRYLTTAPLPAGAVHLLHRACATVKMSAQSGLTVKPDVPADQTLDAEDVMVTAGQMTGIPVSRLGADERSRYAHMVEHLRRRIIGQDEAVLAVSRAVKTARVGLKDPKRPIGSFFFLGPTGVGKTELAKALAEFMFGTEDAMIVLDMTEYQEENAVNRLIGAPPGYVGYEAGGQLTDKVATTPYSVVLFDEVEKAHARVLDVLLQVMEEGRLTDGKGRTVNFSETVIILTSNIGSQYLVDPGLSSAFAQDTAEEELKRHFRPEFLNRLDDIIFFNALSDDDLRRILDLMLKTEVELVAGRNLKLEVTDDARAWLVQQNEHPEWGARPLRRIIQKHIREPMADWLLIEDPLPGSTVRVEVKGQSLEFQKGDSWENQV
ncbi:MAG: ATP-dependent Clp protease ATP-binding subunit [Anaerolineae bacterium]